MTSLATGASAATGARAAAGARAADEAEIRQELAARYPEAWARIQARRACMADQLGIELHPDVLPFSNIPAWLPPFLLDTGRAMSLA